MKDNNNIGSLIRKKRKEKGLTLEQVASFIGVSEMAISRWERNEVKNIKCDKINVLCNILDISPSLFITGLVDENEKKEFNRKEYKINVINMTNNCTELSEQEKRIIISIMNVL